MRWDDIRAMPTVMTTVDPSSRGTHESVLRSYHVLDQVKAMLNRGDSTQTVLEFVEWAEEGHRA